MKNNNHNLDFEQLLADVEHAGRDARRRDELAAMIDSMATTEIRHTKHGFWWWGARIAAAACVLFFVTTAVRVWFIPTESNAPMVAETPATVAPAIIDSTVHTPVNPVKPRRVAGNVKPVAATSIIADEDISQQEWTTNAAEEEVLPVVEELLAEEVETTEEPVVEAEGFPIDIIAAPVVSVAYTEPQEQPQEPSRRRNILSSLFRQPEPDDMTGTVLAFRIL